MSKERLTETISRYNQCNDKDCQLSYCDRECSHYQSMIDKLAEYEELEEQRLLLRLPCPIGTKVYYVQKCLAPSCKECLGFTRVDNCYTQYKARIFEQEFNYRHLKAFGESVFLTQSEAEEKLRELEGK